MGCTLVSQCLFVVPPKKLTIYGFIAVDLQMGGKMDILAL